MINSVGQKFGALTVLYQWMEPRKGNGNTNGMLERTVAVKCECGNIVRKKYHNINKHRAKSSLPIKCTRNCPTMHLQSVIKERLGAYKKRCRDANREFTLTEVQFEFLVTSGCHYCGSIDKGKVHINSLRGRDIYVDINTIDRIDSSKGYIPGNVVSACNDCNLLKNNRTYNEFINKIKAIYEFKYLDTLISR